MQAMILCGGKATRLRSLHPDKVKALVPIGGRAFLDWQFESLAREGVNRIHLAAGHRADQLAAWLTERSPNRHGSWHLTVGGRPLAVTLSCETEPLGTGGGIRFALEALLRSHAAEELLIVNGDSLLPRLKLESLIQTHRDGNFKMTLAVTPIQEAGRYGTVLWEQGGRVTGFHEKASRQAGWINAGAYWMASSWGLGWPANQAISLEEVIFPQLTLEASLGAAAMEPPVLDMGTPEGIAALEAYLQTHG